MHTSKLMTRRQIRALKREPLPPFVGLRERLANRPEPPMWTSDGVPVATGSGLELLTQMESVLDAMGDVQGVHDSVTIEMNPRFLARLQAAFHNIKRAERRKRLARHRRQ